MLHDLLFNQLIRPKFVVTVWFFVRFSHFSLHCQMPFFRFTCYMNRWFSYIYEGFFKISVEADKTPFFVNEVFFKFQTYNLTKLCTEKLSEKFQHSVDQASGAITKLLLQLPLCLHITDAELINTKSRFSHDPMSTRNQVSQYSSETRHALVFYL